MNRLVGLIALIAILFSTTTACAQGGFGEADTDQNEKVNLSELETYVSGKLDDFDRFEELFAELDKDKDGSISSDEFEARMQAVQAVIDRPKPTMKKEEPKTEIENKENVVEEFADRYEKMFAKRNPKVGDVISDLSAFDEKGNKFAFENTRGKYTVIVFGCLT